MRTPHFWDYALNNIQQAVLSVLCHGGVLGEGDSSKGVHHEGKTSIWTSGLHWGITHQAVTVATLFDLSITSVSPTAETVATLCSWRSTTVHSHSAYKECCKPCSQPHNGVLEVLGRFHLPKSLLSISDGQLNSGLACIHSPARGQHIPCIPGILCTPCMLCTPGPVKASEEQRLSRPDDSQSDSDGSFLV